MNEGSVRVRGRAALFRKLKGQSEAPGMNLDAGFAECNQPIFFRFYSADYELRLGLSSPFLYALEYFLQSDWRKISFFDRIGSA